jgi:predicted transcriptional regulator
MVLAETEKVTFNISRDLKNRMLVLKEDMSKSLSTLYNEAIQEFLEKRELEKWQKASKLASQDNEYLKIIDLGIDSEEIYEY